MILDDDPLQHRAISRALGADYDYSFHTDSQSLWTQATAPDLFLCDLQLQNSSSFEILAQARSLWPTTARVLVSGQLTESDLIHTINHDLAHRILRKPWTLDELRLSVAEGLSMSRMLKDRQYWQELSLTDAVTHLWNRRGFLQQILRETSRARRHQRTYSLLMIDVDHFKKINDENGHTHGDDVLRKLSRLMTESVRAIDFVGRYGGDEFVILLPETDVAEAFDVAERVRKKAENELQLRLSLGLAAYPDHGEDPGQIIESADKALYTAKTKGRSQTSIATLPPTP